jgi:hypothetical protein
LLESQDSTRKKLRVRVVLQLYDKYEELGAERVRHACTVLTDAREMLLSFMSVGVGSFGVTRKTCTGRVSSYRLIEAHQLVGLLGELVPAAEARRESIIIRPFSASETTQAIIQIDDLTNVSYEPLIPLSFCITETSPASYQAFVCVSNGAAQYHSIRQQIIETANGDRGATCAARLAGTLNNKASRQREDGTYPHVRLIHTAPRWIVEVETLVAVGLINQPLDCRKKSQTKQDIKGKSRRAFKRAAATLPIRLPSYQLALSSVRIKDDGKPDRSAADLLFAITCLHWKPPVPREQISLLLHNYSEKAQERSDRDWYVEATIDEAIRRA